MMFYLDKKLETDRNRLETYNVPDIATLRSYKPQASGARWVPVNHMDLIRNIDRAVQEAGYEIESEQFQHTRFGRGDKAHTNRHNLFGFFTVRGCPDTELDGITRVLGFRHSNVQDYALKVLSGARVDLCTNGMANGEYVADHKHTTQLSLRDLVNQGVSKWKRLQEQLGELIARLRTIGLTDQQAAFMLVKAAEKDVISSDKILPVWNEYVQPTHEEFSARNAWCLTQAVTEKAKGWALSRQETAIRDFPAMLDASGPQLRDQNTFPILN